MFVATCFNNSSLFGYTATALKSGVCKYYRRKENKKFMWCVLELLAFQTVEKGGMLVTNLVNRLKILLMEDLSVLEVWRVKEGIRLLTLFEKENRSELLLDFCSLVEGGRRSRLVSYAKNFWKLQESPSYEVELTRIKKYRVTGDSNELLRMGEVMLRLLDEGDDGVIRVLLDMLLLKEKCGRRFRRNDGVYLFWKLMEGRVDDDVLEFGLNRFFKKDMRERDAFAVWVCLLALTKKKARVECVEVRKWSMEEYEEVEKKRERLILDEYVVKDWHVNRMYTLEKFRNVGAFVVDEELGVLEGEEMYRELYMTTIPSPPMKVKREKRVKKNVCIPPEEKIDWNEFENVVVLEKGVCGGKVCCLDVRYRGKRFVLKEMKKSMNEGLDYKLMDSLKSMVGLKDLKMRRIESNGGLIKLDLKKGYKGNWRLGVRERELYIV